MGDFLLNTSGARGTAENVAKAYRDGNTNYPPSSGVPELCEAVASIYRDFFGLDYGADGLLEVVLGRLYATWARFAQPEITLSASCLLESKVLQAPDADQPSIHCHHCHQFSPHPRATPTDLPTVQPSTNSPLNQPAL